MPVASSVVGFDVERKYCAKLFPKSLPLGIGNALKNGCIAGTAFCRALTEGTVTTLDCGCRSRSPSSEKKKNVRFFPLWKDGPPSPKRGKYRGPPNTPPKSFWRIGGFFRFGLLLTNQSVASSASLRK